MHGVKVRYENESAAGEMTLPPKFHFGLRATDKRGNETRRPDKCKEKARDIIATGFGYRGTGLKLRVLDVLFSAHFHAACPHFLLG